MTKLKIREIGLELFESNSVYRPFTEAERQLSPREAVDFQGDIPSSGGLERNQYRLEYQLAREPHQVADLIYTPEGMAWVGGTLFEKFSLRRPSIKDLLARPNPRACSSIPRATLVQCETPYTYGDWASEFLCSLTGAMPLRSPLLIPRQLMAKPYVRRDLSLLGVEAIEAGRDILVREATVLPKGRPSHYWKASEVDAYRRAFGIVPPSPRPGSILYISRQGERGESTQRTYPSEQVADVLAALGARIVLARETSLEEFRELGVEAETVIGDHGAAMCNLLFWKPRRVIELFTHRFWTSCFLFLAAAIDTRDYTLINGDNFSTHDFKRTIKGRLGSTRELSWSA